MKDELSFLNKLKREIKLWVSEGIITSEQETKILSRYKVLAEAEEKVTSSKLITVISVMGSVLVGIGLILFIASNWRMIPRFGKISIIFLSLFSSYSLGYYFRYEKKNLPKVGASLILLGSIIFGAGIFLIAQIYNISVHYPNGFLIWGLGILPLAYLLRFKTILFLALLDLVIWLPAELSFHIPLYSSVMVYMTMFLFLGVCFFSLGLLQSTFEYTKELSRTYITLGSPIIFGSLLYFTFEIVREKFAFEKGLYPFLYGFSLIFVLSFLCSITFVKKDKFQIIENFVLLALFLFGVFYLLTNLTDGGRSNREVFLISFNLFYVFLIVGIIYLGFLKKEKIYVNVGLLFFVLNIFARYFDFFFRLLPRSVFFIFGGLLLIFGGIFLEKKRRKVLKSFNLEEESL